MAKKVWCYVLDNAGVTGIEDVNGGAISSPEKFMIYVCADNNAELADDGSKKLYHSTDGVIDPQELDAIVKAYHPPTPIAKPDKVTGIATSGVTKTEIKLDWDSMARAANYHVTVTPTVTGYPKDVSVNSDTVQGLTAATAYTFKIKACNVSGCGAESQKTETTAT